MNHLGDTNKMVGEDHIRDATKMVSDTPRTDAKRGFHDLDTAVDAEFSEQLERELNAASKERDDALMMLGMYRMKSDEQNQRIKRLEEAGDKMFWTLDAEETGSVGKEMWRKAKEAKL